MPNDRRAEAPPTTPELTTSQVAQLLQRDVRTVHRMVATGRLKAKRVPGYKGPLLIEPAEAERVRRLLAGESAPTGAAAGAA